MNEPVSKSSVSLRRWLIRAAAIAVYAGLIALVFITGKGHTILIDNKNAEDGSVPAIDGVMVSVDGREALELYKGDRDRENVSGQNHRVSVEIIADGRKIEKSIRLPIGEDILLLSIPMLVAGREPALIPFVAPVAPPPPDEGTGSTDSSVPVEGM